MLVTEKELKTNLDEYLKRASEEEILISQNGKIVAKLTTPHQDRVETAKSLFGIISGDITLEEARMERITV